MKKLLRQGRKLVRVGRKLALATSACIDRCCGGHQTLYYRLKLCGPPLATVPQYIAVAVPFLCGSCPLNTGRIVIYRGHCYEALGPLSCLHPLICAEGRCEADKLLRANLEPTDVIVNGADLTCKPLTVTCETVPCIPVQPGCCSTSNLSPYCGDGSTRVECKMPKRFRVTRTGSYRNRGWTYATAPCADYYQCQDWRLDFTLIQEYQCIETGGRYTEATLRSTSGSMTASGIPYPFEIVNGTRSFLGLEDVGILISAITAFSTFNCNGPHDPSYGDTTAGGCIRTTESCEGGRHIVTQLGTCLNGFFNRVDYEDCWIKRTTMTSIGRFSDPCPADTAWQESIDDQTLISNLIACPEDRDIVHINPGDPTNNGSIIPGARDFRFPRINSAPVMGGTLY